MYISKHIFSQGLHQIILPPNNGSIIIEDIILTGTKSRNCEVDLYFTDQNNSFAIYNEKVTDDQIQFVAKGLNWKGWRNAGVYIGVTGLMDVHISMKVKKIFSGVTYKLWEKT